MKRCHCGMEMSFYLMSDGCKYFYCLYCDRGFRAGNAVAYCPGANGQKPRGSCP